MFMLAALAFGGAQFAGNAMGAFGAKQAAAQNAMDLRWNAAMARINANDVMANAETQVADLKDETKSLKSAQVASYAAQGVDVGSDVTASVLEDTDAKMWTDVGRIRESARKKAWGLQAEAMKSEQQARREAKRGRYALMGGLLGAGGQFGSQIVGGRAQDLAMGAK